jgi:hypothetical protein
VKSGCADKGLQCPEDYECLCRPCELIVEDENTTTLILSVVLGLWLLCMLLWLAWVVVQSERLKKKQIQDAAALESTIRTRTQFLSFMCHGFESPSSSLLTLCDLRNPQPAERFHRHAVAARRLAGGVRPRRRLISVPVNRSICATLRVSKR